MSENREEFYDLLRELTGVYTEPNKEIGQCNNVPDCPIMGSGKIAIAVEGSYAKQTYFISKTDFWYAGGKKVFDYDSDTVEVHYPPFTIQPAALGGLTLQIGTESTLEKTVSGYRQEQDLLLAEVRSELPLRERESLHIRSFAPFHDNYMFLEISGNQEPVSIRAELWVHVEEESNTKADLYHTTLWCKSCYQDIWDMEAAMAAKVIGAADVKADTDQRQKSWVEFTVKPHQPVWIAVAVAGGKDETDSEKKAVHMVNHADGKEIRETECRHREAWEDYWLKSYVLFHDSTLERFYYGALYELACVTDPEGHVPPGIAGGWIHNENPLWSGNYTMNYNAQAPFWGVYSANRPELGMPFVRMVMDYLEEGKKLAEEKGTKGVLIPVHINPWGSCDLRDTVCQKSNASLAAVNFIWQYEFTQDLDFLKDAAYPYIMECVEFWEDNICLEENGKYAVAEAAQRERWPGDRNPNSDLAHVRKIFSAAIRWSQTLGVDAERREHWKDVIENLSGYPTMVYEDKIVFKEAENRNQISFFGLGDNPVNLDHVYPIEALEMQEDEKLKIIARNTIDVMNSWNQSNAFPRIFSQAVRVDWPGEDILRRFKERLSLNLYPSEVLRSNQTIVPDNHGLEAVGAIEFLNSMLVRAYNGIIHVFPGWPDSKEVSFKNLRTQGAFLVSARLEKGEISDVKIISEHGGICSLKSPWKDRMLVVSEITQGGSQQVRTKCVDSVISWETKAGGIYVVESVSEVFEEKADADMRKLPIPMMVIPMVAIEDRPRSGQGDGAIDLILTPEKRSVSITVNVHMSDGTILKNYQNFELSSENETVVKAENQILTAGDNAGTAKVKVLVRENGGVAENQITAAVVKRNILSDISVETGAGYDGWKHPIPLMWDAECMTSGIGMSGPDMDAMKRGNPYGFGMWLTPENQGENAWVIFDLKKTWTLDEMWIWNYNCWEDGKEKHIWGCGSRCGMKKVKIFYSSDKVAWEELKGDGYPYEFSKAEGNAFSPATNLNNQEKTPVRFHGVKARFVKIVADKIIGEGNWGGSRYGLSAVRFCVEKDSI